MGRRVFTGLYDKIVGSSQQPRYRRLELTEALGVACAQVLHKPAERTTIRLVGQRIVVRGGKLEQAMPITWPLAASNPG